MSVLRQLLQLFVAGALFVGCGAGLASGVYRLDINHLEAQMKARVGAMPARVRAKMQAADLRLSVDGDTAKLLSNAAAKGEPPRFHVRWDGKRFVLEAKRGPNVSCTRVDARSLDCTMPHGAKMRFTRAP